MSLEPPPDHDVVIVGLPLTRNRVGSALAFAILDGRGGGGLQPASSLIV